ncbi:unnamed protein product, partial [Iphiclides podalirius]
MSKVTFLWKLLYLCEKLHCYATVFVLTPGFLIFEMVVVRPELAQIYQAGVAKQILHIFLSMFCFVNVAGNMMLSILSDCKLKIGLQTAQGGEFCELCQIYRPPKAWHCRVCNACIIRRDHHCFFFSRCIGLYNMRYYLLYIAHIHITMVYSSYYNYYFVSSKFKGHGFALSAFCVLNPLLRYVITEKLTINDFYVLMFLMNIGLVFWSGFLLWFHVKNALRGVTARDYRDPATRSWRQNFLSVFGSKWYLAIVWPFADSPAIEESKLEGNDH